MHQDDEVVSCGCYLAVLTFNILIGAIASDFLIRVIFNTNIPLFWDMVIGLVAGEIIVPVALVLWLLRRLGVV